MNIKKIYDASVLINILEDLDFPEIMVLWNQNPRYEQWITSEINNEIKRLARKKLDELINQEIIKIFDPVPQDKLDEIEIDYPKLSQPDCSLYYYCMQLNDCICLTNDKPLRDYLELNNLRKFGTYGIYNKLKKDNSFPLKDIESKFAILKKDPRVFPANFKENP